MDMNTAFELEIRAHCPQAAIVYGLFHVLARYGREVADRVRVEPANARRVIKRMAYSYPGEAYFFLKIRAAFSGVGR